MKVKVKKEAGAFEQGGIELLKAGGALVVGAGHGVVKEAVSERAAGYYRLTMAGSGLALRLTQKRNSLAYEAGGALLFGAAALEGSERGAGAAKAWKEHTRKEREDAEAAKLILMKDQLRSDLGPSNATQGQLPATQEQKQQQQLPATTGQQQDREAA